MHARMQWTAYIGGLPQRRDVGPSLLPPYPSLWGSEEERNIWSFYFLYLPPSLPLYRKKDRP